MTRYKKRCYSWDVVNEALNENGTLRDSVFLRVLGPSYLPISFLAAERADPDAKLYYNDFNLETSPLKAEGAARIVKIIRDGGGRIDGLGFQAHLRAGQTPSQTQLTATLRRFTDDLGLEVALSELDIALNLTTTTTTANPRGSPSEQALLQQTADYLAAVGACLAVPKCVGITVWQFTDKYSWIPGTFPGLGDACLFDANFTRKPAYFAVENLLLSVAESVRAVVSGEAAATTATATMKGNITAAGAGGAGGVGSGFNRTAFGQPGQGGDGMVGGNTENGPGNNDAADAALRSNSGGGPSLFAADYRGAVTWVLGVTFVLVVLL